MTDDVLNEIFVIRVNQDERWGKQRHSPYKWLAIVQEELGKAAKASLNIDSPGEKGMETQQLAIAKLRDQYLQAAAVLIAAVECLDEEVA